MVGWGSIIIIEHICLRPCSQAPPPQAPPPPRPPPHSVPVSSSNVLLVDHPDELNESKCASNVADHSEELEEVADPSCAEETVNEALIVDAPQDVEQSLPSLPCPEQTFS